MPEKSMLARAHPNARTEYDLEDLQSSNEIEGTASARFISRWVTAAILILIIGTFLAPLVLPYLPDGKGN